ncbi:hypothetical protein Tco_1393118 [Tanacetum coccineum]
MANLSKDIQCASSDNRPPMLDRTDFASWQQRIRLCYRGKENGVNILKAAKRYLLSYQSFPNRCKGEYEIMLKIAPGTVSELTKEDRESQLYDDFETLPGQRTGERKYHSRPLCPVCQYSSMDMRKSSINMYSNAVEPPYLINNMLHAGYGGAQNRVGNANPGQAKQIKCYTCNGIGVPLDEVSYCLLHDGQDNPLMKMKDVYEQSCSGFALNVDNVFQADDCECF